MIIYFCLMVLLISHQVTSKVENCFCVPMDRKDLTNGTEPLFSQPLKVLKDCGEESRKTCLSLCKSLATLAQYDPRSAQGFCVQVKRNITNVQVSVFSKTCDGDYEFTGLTFNKPICCINKKHVPC